MGRIVTDDAGHGSRFIGTKSTVGTLAYRMSALPTKTARDLATMTHSDFIKSWRAAVSRRQQSKSGD